MVNNPHEILGVPRNATEKEIKAAFRKLAKQYHPDINHEKGAEERFKSINEAYNAIRTGDYTQTVEYDPSKRWWEQGQTQQRSTDWRPDGGYWSSVGANPGRTPKDFNDFWSVWEKMYEQYSADANRFSSNRGRDDYHKSREDAYEEYYENEEDEENAFSNSSKKEEKHTKTTEEARREWDAQYHEEQAQRNYERQNRQDRSSYEEWDSTGGTQYDHSNHANQNAQETSYRSERPSSERKESAKDEETKPQKDTTQKTTKNTKKPVPLELSPDAESIWFSLIATCFGFTFFSFLNAVFGDGTPLEVEVLLVIPALLPSYLHFMFNKRFYPERLKGCFLLGLFSLFCMFMMVTHYNTGSDWVYYLFGVFFGCTFLLHMFVSACYDPDIEL